MRNDHFKSLLKNYYKGIVCFCAKALAYRTLLEMVIGKKAMKTHTDLKLH